jgi:holo-ACP synthase/triphosphoribosyl-dephospho-CoA synthase
MTCNLFNEIAEIALEAMIMEVELHPKFGLVSKENSGCHSDMDIHTFFKSAESLKPYFYKVAEISFSDIDLYENFYLLRKMGMEAEEAMLQTTNNINTHKGLIFVLGIVVSAATQSLFKNESLSYLPTRIKHMTQHILDDFKSISLASEKLTYGEKIYLKYGITGIRGEVYNGIPSIFRLFDDGLAKKNLYHLNHQHDVLIKIMSVLNDTTVLHRRDLSILNKVKKDAKSILRVGSVYTQAGRKLLNDLSDEYIEEGISPGGSADLLATTFFLWKFNKLYLERI